MDHNYTILGDQSRGLRTRYTGLYTPPLGNAYRFVNGRMAMPARRDLRSFDRSPTGQHQPISRHPSRSQGSGFQSTREFNGYAFIPLRHK